MAFENTQFLHTEYEDTPKRLEYTAFENTQFLQTEYEQTRQKFESEKNLEINSFDSWKTIVHPSNITDLYLCMRK